MEATWKLQDAKNKFSELVARAESGEPQIVTKRGVEAVAIVSAASFRSRNSDSSNSAFVDFLFSMPKGEEFEASEVKTREVLFK